jgi:hypothetical protein
VDGVQQTLHGLPLLLRYAVTGAVALGLLGAAVGLVLGLRAYAPTAWAAVFQVGLPATVLGAVGGAAVASVVLLVHAVHRLRHR